MKNEILQFDIRKYLTSQGIHFKEGGGSIGICCPCCGDDDFHLGIRTDSKVYNCWRCDEQGYLVRLITLLEDISYHEASKRIEGAEPAVDRSNFQDKVKDMFAKKTIEEKKKEQKKGNLRVPYTKYLSELNPEFDLDKLFLDFIKERRYTVEELEEWGVRAQLFDGHAYRLMFPVALRKRVVNYLGRSVVTTTDMKYKNCSNEEAIFPMRDFLYGYDYIEIGQDDLVICEGVFDVIRFGKGVAVGIFGKTITVNQMELICSLRIKNRIMIILDGDAGRDADKIVKELRPIVESEVVMVNLDHGCDPDDISREELLEFIS